jgi:polyisoprenoid-binding protein YceI
MYYFRAIWVAVSIASALSAKELTVNLDSTKTQIAFLLVDVLHTVHGTFRLKQGHISFDPATAQ